MKSMNHRKLADRRSSGGSSSMVRTYRVHKILHHVFVRQYRNLAFVRANEKKNIYIYIGNVNIYVLFQC